MTPFVLSLLAAALLLWPAPAGGTRLSGMTGPGGSAEPAEVDPPPVRSPARRRAGAVGAGFVVALAVGGVGGVVTGCLVSVAADRLLARANGAEPRRRRERREAALPGALDLLCVCLDVGLPPGPALGLVAPGVPLPLRSDLAAVCALYELGAEAASAWAEWRTDPVLGAVARTMSRSGHSGSALTAALRAVSAQIRADLDQRAESAARRAGVFVLAPLGLCFLPAFVCLGVVPTVLGIAADVLP